MGEDPFESYNRFADRVLGSIDRGEPSGKKFKFLMGVINETLVATHKLVIARLGALQDAMTAEEANALLERLRLEELTEAFRVEGLCDLLEGLGTGLIGRVEAARTEGVFSQEELSSVGIFAEMLYHREAEVATIYGNALSDITHPAGQLDEASLPELKRKANELQRLLTNHVSDFNAKADKFTKLSVV